MSEDETEEERPERRDIQISVPRPLSLLPLLTVILLIGAVIGWLLR